MESIPPESNAPSTSVVGATPIPPAAPHVVGMVERTSLPPRAGTSLPPRAPSAPPNVVPRARVVDADTADDPWRRRTILIVTLGLGLVALAGLGAFGYRMVTRYLEVAPEEIVSNVEHASRDGRVSFVVPSTFVEETGLHRSERQADLVLFEAASPTRILVMNLEKRAFGGVVILAQIANAIRRSSVGVREIQLGRSVDVRFAGHAAVEFPFEGMDDARAPIRGLLTVVDGDGYYHLVIAYSSRGRFEAQEERIRGILATTRLHLH